MDDPFFARVPAWKFFSSDGSWPFCRGRELQILNDALAEGHIESWVVDARGTVTSIPKTFWWLGDSLGIYCKIGDDSEPATCEPPETDVFDEDEFGDEEDEVIATVRLGDRIIQGEVFVRRDDLEALCRTPAAMSAAGALRAVPRSTAQADLPANSNPCGNAKGECFQTSTRQPERTRAAQALRELFPEGVPGPDVLTHSDLNRKVNQHLKMRGLREITRWTILRAAGRWR